MRYTKDTIPAGTITLEEAKAIAKKDGVKAAGLKFFVEKTGSLGEILPTLSAHGKVQARMTCNMGGPDHIRENSDWGQCGTSPEMKKSKKPAKTSTQTVAEAEKVRAKLKEDLEKAQAEAGLLDDTLKDIAQDEKDLIEKS